MLQVVFDSPDAGGTQGSGLTMGGVSVSVRTFIYRSSLLTLVMVFSCSANAEKGQNPPENGGAAPAEQPSTPPVKISNEPVGSSTTHEELVADPGPRSFLRNFVDDQKHIWTGPTRISRRELKWVLPLAAGVGTAIATDNRLSEELPNPDDPARIAGKHVSQLGALYTVAGISAGTYLIGRFAAKERLRDTGWIGLEALAHTQIVVRESKQLLSVSGHPSPSRVGGSDGRKFIPFGARGNHLCVGDGSSQTIFGEEDRADRGVQPGRDRQCSAVEC